MHVQYIYNYDMHVQPWIFSTSTPVHKLIHTAPNSKCSKRGRTTLDPSQGFLYKGRNYADPLIVLG